MQSPGSPPLNPALGGDDDQAPRGLNLRHSDSYRDLARASLRAELAQGTAIWLKPRGRQIGVALTSQW